jgi:hypothetical protein
MMPPRFGPAISWLQKLFAEAPRQVQTRLNFALIGGLSVAAWGAIRATQDIDFLLDSEPSPTGDLALRKNLADFFNYPGAACEIAGADPKSSIPSNLEQCTRVEFVSRDFVRHEALTASLTAARPKFPRAGNNP